MRCSTLMENVLFIVNLNRVCWISSTEFQRRVAAVRAWDVVFFLNSLLLWFFLFVSLISFWALIASEKKLLQFGWRKHKSAMVSCVFVCMHMYRVTSLTVDSVFFGGHWTVTERIVFLMDTLMRRLVRSGLSADQLCSGNSKQGENDPFKKLPRSLSLLCKCM